MTTNPYAPPSANVDDPVQEQAAPALWNPNAAANWSLLFSPVFGAFLHMKNWQALGEPAKAYAAKLWIFAGLAIFTALVFAPVFIPVEEAKIDLLARPIALVFLLSWYFISGKAQATYVKARFGKTYPRKGWLKPLLFAVLAIIGFIVILGLIGFIIGLVIGVT